MAENQQALVDKLIADRAPHKVAHADDLEWKKIRWPGEWGKIAFHPNDADPTEPLFGITKFEPGGHFPDHAHDFAQVWYVLEGECTIGGDRVTAGSFVYHPDPHVERALHTESGVTILFCQYPGATTGERPIYHDRFDLDERKAMEEEPATY